MTIFEKVKNKFSAAEQKTIENFWAAYNQELGKQRVKPDSRAARAAQMGITAEALRQRELRAANPKPKGRPKKKRENT